MFNWFFRAPKAGAIENAQHELPKIRDHERESDFGYIFSVSGPGNFFLLVVARCVLAADKGGPW